MDKPIESVTVSKTGDERGNHDAIVINDRYLAVIDAYQARGWRAWDGLPAGVFAKNILADALEELDGTMDAQSVIAELERRLLEKSQECVDGFKDKQVYAFPQARVLIYSVDKQEIWRLGDSPFAIDGELHYQPSDAVVQIAQKRAEVTERFLADKKSDLKDLIENDYGRSAAMELVVEEERRVDGTESLSGRPETDVDELLKHLEVVQVQPGQEIILASDGFPRIEATLEESERWLSEERARDPLFIHDYKAVKGAKDEEAGYDDRSYIRFIA